MEQRIMEAFQQEYLTVKEPFNLKFVGFTVEAKPEDSGDDVEDTSIAKIDFTYNGQEMHAEAAGDGPVDAVKQALRESLPDVNVSILDYDEHALTEGSKSKAVSYVQMRNNDTGKVTFGVGISTSITRATIRAMFSALNRLV